MIKLVMAVIMLMVLVSRGLMIPVYLSQLGIISPLSEVTVKILKSSSFIGMVIALLTGALIIWIVLFKGLREDRKLRRLVELPSSDVMK